MMFFPEPRGTGAVCGEVTGLAAQGSWTLTACGLFMCEVMCEGKKKRPKALFF